MTIRLVIYHRVMYFAIRGKRMSKACLMA